MAKIAERVRKLQALAAGSDGAEAESAAAMARKLMMEHALSQADVDSTEREEDPLVRYELHFVGLHVVGKDDGVNFRWHEKIAHWKRNLAQVVGDYLGLVSSYKEKYNVWYWHGYQSDCQMAISLWTICARQIDRLSREHVARRKRMREEDGGPWYSGESKEMGNAFRTAAVVGLREKFNQLLWSEREEKVEGSALMVARKARVKDWVDTTYTFRKGHGFDQSNKAWSSAGYEAGKKIKLTEDAGLPGSTNHRLEG